MSGEPKDPCPLCNGVEWMRGSDNLKATPCRCIHARMMKQFMGPEIAMAENIRSPLFEVDAEPIDRSTENLFIKAKWRDLTNHLKWVLGCKFNLNKGYRFRITSDERILQIRLGSESYAQRAKGVRDNMDTFNNLNDLVGDVDLLIIRLGFLGHKNIAAAGYLKEALGLRELALKPTWLNEEPGMYFGEGHHAWSNDVDDYILEHFDVVDLRTTSDVSNPEPPSRARAISVGESDDDTVGIGPRGVESSSVATFEESIAGSEEDRQDFRGAMRKRAGGWKPGKKRTPGNGPAGMGF